jgi:phosphoenolpyruvate carboxykinase (GTP)
MRVLKWIVDRVRGNASAIESPLGLIPTYDDLEWQGMTYSRDRFLELMRIEQEAGMDDARSQEELFDRFLDRMPKELLYERELLKSRLWRTPNSWDLN